MRTSEESERPDWASHAQLAREIFRDHEVYRHELENVFSRCWLFVAHTSQLSRPGDYLTNFLGEQSCIVVKTETGYSVLLNRCPVCEQPLCWFDRGHADGFSCVDGHVRFGVTGESNGERSSDRIDGVHVEVFEGLIFANLAPAPVDLDAYLGEAKWYLSSLISQGSESKLEFLPGRHRYLLPCNWKLIADNFAGDMYHFDVTHASMISLAQHKSGARIARPLARNEQQYSTVVAMGAPDIAHTMNSVAYGTSFLESDLAQAETLGPDAVEWVHERYRRIGERASDRGDLVAPYGTHIGTIFPNLSYVGMSTALYGRGFLQWHPRGPYETEVWEWCAVDVDAPQSVRDRMRFVLQQRQSAAGLVAADDYDNFEKMRDNLLATGAPGRTFDYSMGVNAANDESVLGFFGPGTKGALITERSARAFYTTWESLLESDSVR